MAYLHITEYMEGGGEPALAEQAIPLGQEPAQSNPFHRSTRSVRIVADADCAVLFGTDPVAARGHGMLPAKREQIRTIGGQGLRVSAVLLANEASLNTSSVEGLIALITNKDAAERRLKDLKALHDASKQASEQLAKDQDDLAKRQAAFEIAESALREKTGKWAGSFTATSEDLAKRETTVAEQKKALEEECAAYVRDRTEREAELARREEAVASRTRELQAKEDRITELNRQMRSLSTAMS